MNKILAPKNSSCVYCGNPAVIQMTIGELLPHFMCMVCADKEMWEAGKLVSREEHRAGWKKWLKETRELR